jgi:signal transduction histidine kinase
MRERQATGKLRALLEAVARLPPLVQVVQLRHVALLIAGVAAFSWRDELAFRTPALWVLLTAVLANLAAGWWVTRGRNLVGFRWTSLIASLTTWGTLVAITGASESPFLVGFLLEIGLSVVAFSARELLLVGALTLATLWIQQAAQPVALLPDGLRVQSGLLVVYTLIAGAVAHRTAQQQRHLSGQASALRSRAVELEGQLQASRELGQIGEVSARQAHQFKSLVASLRGFLNLLDNNGADRGELEAQSLEGVRRAVDQMERAVQSMLHPRLLDTNTARMTQDDLRAILDEVTRQVTCVHRGIHWIQLNSGAVPDVAFPASALREVALVLTENAAEASGESGTVVVQVDSGPDGVRVVVEDDGPGLSLAENDLFQWGVSTKRGGNGAGLFLSKRLVESLGGGLCAAPCARGGMAFSITLPLYRG